jgi:hypothetical protein
MNTCAYNKAMSNSFRNREELAALRLIVVEEVHPSQFSTLPPSPREIDAKGRLLGLEVKRYSF